MMSKSELIQKIADETSLAKKDVKAVIESLASVGYKELKKSRRLPAARLCQVRRHQEAGHQGAHGHQSVHQGADRVQGEAGPQDASRFAR